MTNIQRSWQLPKIYRKKYVGSFPRVWTPQGGDYISFMFAP